MEQKRNLQDVAKRVGRFFRDNQRMPTYQEMLELLGVRSKSVVNFWVNKLIDGGFLEKDQTGHLRLIKRPTAIPMVGTVQAGFPSPAEECLCDAVSMDDYLIARPESSFLVQVSGDSMEGAGILEGDMVIIEKERDPRNGDIVIAEVDGEWTLKYFKNQGPQVFLEAANPKYPVIRARTELRLGGVVVAVIRRYH